MLMVSNFGGMSYLEMGALVDELLEQLARNWGIEPSRVICGPLETSLNAPAFSVSVINVTAAAANCSYSVSQIKDFFDIKTNTYWESMAGSQSKRRSRKEQIVRPALQPKKTVDDAKDLKIDPRTLDSMLRKACDNLIQAEPDLTKWDTIMGDGDCGETLKTGAQHLLAALDRKLASGGSVIAVLQELEDIVESKMGGTLGGILGIFFVSLRTALEQNIDQGLGSEGIPELWGKALGVALDNLGRYTPAKEGDRTVMDTLLPFADLMATGNFDEAIRAAAQGAEATRTMKPRLGRATYVGQDTSKDSVPDPGAWGALVAIRGLREGM